MTSKKTKVSLCTERPFITRVRFLQKDLQETREISVSSAVAFAHNKTEDGIDNFSVVAIDADAL